MMILFLPKNYFKNITKIFVCLDMSDNGYQIIMERIVQPKGMSLGESIIYTNAGMPLNVYTVVL